MPYYWSGWGSDKSRGDFEAEERTVGRHVTPLHKYLVDVLWLPESCHRAFRTPVIAGEVCKVNKVSGLRLSTKRAAKAA